MKPTNHDITAALKAIEATELPEQHPRKLAARAVDRYRHQRSTQMLTQQQIDSGSDNEQRRQRFVSASVKWSRRSLWARILRRR